MKIIKYYGPPGTGKTTKLLSIFEKELEQFSPEDIGVVTFTREGANQFLTRAMDKFKLPKEKFPYIKTLHALTFKLLNFSKENIMQPNDYRTLGKALAMNFMGHYGADFNSEDDRYLFLTELLRNNAERVSHYVEDFEKDKLDYVARQYRRYKNAYMRADFTDLIEIALYNETTAPVKIAFIDEAQDLTTLQRKAALMLFRKVERLYIAGDDDQAIYTWSGADVKAFLERADEEYTLDVSYRLPEKPLQLARAISARIQTRAEKDYHGTGRAGEVSKVTFTQLERILKLRQNETWFVLFRTNSAVTEFANQMYKRGIPFIHKDEPSLPEKYLRRIRIGMKKRADLTQDERLLHGEMVIGGFIKDDKLDLDRLLEDVEPKKARHIREFLSACDGDLEPVYNIRVSTIHTVKGGEAENVAVYLGMTNKTFQNLQNNPDDEHRVFYVAVTRTKNRLYIVPAEDTMFEYDIGEI